MFSYSDIHKRYEDFTITLRREPRRAKPSTLGLSRSDGSNRFLDLHDSAFSGLLNEIRDKRAFDEVFISEIELEFRSYSYLMAELLNEISIDVNTSNMYLLKSLIKDIRDLIFMSKLNYDFLEASKTGNLPLLKKLLIEGADVNFAEEDSGANSLHFASGSGAVDTVEWLLGVKGIDVLAKDSVGRLASQRAFEIAGNATLGQKLLDLELETAKSRGIDYLSYVSR